MEVVNADLALPKPQEQVFVNTVILFLDGDPGSTAWSQQQ